MAPKPPPHIEAFEVWYFSSRSPGSMEDLAKELKDKGICSLGGAAFSDRTLRNWKQKHGWVGRAQKRDADIQARTDERAVESIAEMNLRHAKGAIAFQDRCKQGMFEKRKTNFKGITDATKGYQIAVGVERTARGEASVIAEQREIETVTDIQAMVDKMSEEERVDIGKNLDKRKKVEIVSEIDNGDGTGDGTGEENPGDAE